MSRGFGAGRAFFRGLGAAMASNSSVVSRAEKCPGQFLQPGFVPGAVGVPGALSPAIFRLWSDLPSQPARDSLP